ncbi:unnamed protein product [Enterobius vermicularis]|uniref:Col_cuticle_N domain-containing protein n=1 Tax=Enterobius vermicularis TaxID=51028 RepID=A0A0N4VI99_ENTVE|nr:unnamed protein product [Enterobius vermicularis]
MPEKKCDSSVDRLRCVTLYSISISTFATLACVIAVPLFCNYLQSMNALMQNELEFCKSRSVGIWKEVTKTQLCISSKIFCHKNKNVLEALAVVLTVSSKQDKKIDASGAGVITQQSDMSKSSYV